MHPRKRILKYLALCVLTIFVGGVVFVAGKTPKIIDAVVAKVVLDLQKNQGIRLSLGPISVEGFLTVKVDGFVLEKKDIGLFIQAKSIRARLSPLGYWYNGNPVSRIEIDTPEVMAKIDLKLEDSKTESFKPNFTLNELIIYQGRADITLNDKVVQIVNLQTNSKITPRLLDIRSLLIQTPEVNFMARGKMLFNDPVHLGLGSELDLRLSGKLSEIPEIRRLSIPIDATVSLQGRLRYPDLKRGFEFEGRTMATGIRIDTVEIASLSSVIFANQKGLELRKAEVGFAGTKVNVAAQLQFDKQLHFSGKVDAKGASLYELLSNLDVKNSWVDLKLDAKALVEGQIKPEFSLHGQAKGQASGLVVKEKKFVILETAYPIEFEMDIGVDTHAFHFKKAKFRDAKSHLVADCDLFLDDRQGMWLEGIFENLDFASVKNRIADSSYVGVGKGQVSIEGAYEHLKIRAPTHMQDFEFEGIGFGSVTGDVSFEEDQIFVKNVKAQKKSLEYEGNLAVQIKKPVQLVLDAKLNKGHAEDLTDGLLPGSVQGHVMLSWPLESKAHVDLSILNKGRNMTAVLNLEHGDGNLKILNSLLGDVDFALKLKDEQLEAQGIFKGSHATSNVKMDLVKQVPFSASVFMPYGPLKNLMPDWPEFDDFNARAGIYLSAKGDLGHIEDADVDLNLSPAVFYLGTLKFLATDKLVARYEKRQLLVKPILFRSVHGDQIELQGNLDAKQVDIDAKINGDLWFLTHLDERIEGAYGDLSAKVHIQGPPEGPSYFGNVQIAPGSYVSLRDYPPGLTHLSGQIELEGDRGNVKLQGQADRGNFDLNGFVDLKQGSFEDLRVDLKQMPVYYSTFLTGDSNGFLRLDGPFREPTLSGDIKFSQMLFTKDLDPTQVKPLRSRAQKQAVKLNVLLSADDNVRVESRSLNAELKGNLNLVGTSNSPGLMGELTVLSGEIYFRNYYYHIVKARANFDNPFRIVPYIDVEANTQILDYDVTVRAQGELSRPKLVFSSKPFLSQTDLLSLMTFGFTNRDNRDNLGVARTAGLEALSAYSGVGDRVLKLLPERSIDELRLGTLYNQNGGVTSSVVLGMEVFKGMRLRFQSAMLQNTTTGNREKRLELEKYINKRWRWRLIWNSEGNTNYGDAGADLWIRWDF